MLTFPGKLQFVTTLYAPKDRYFRCDGGPHRNFKNFDRIYTFKYLPNSAVCILKTSFSFHGVEQNPSADILRNLIQVCVAHQTFLSASKSLRLIPNNKEAVDALHLKPNSMDIVIDDADHTFVGQERTLHVMWPYVRLGGYYIIEDVEWDRDGDPRLYPILHAPSHYFQPGTLEILMGNDAFFADTSLGHRNWDLWQKRTTTSWAVDRITHNSHVVVIRKRIAPLRPISINLREKAFKWTTRNALCPYGSGKRFKRCHGKPA